MSTDRRWCVERRLVGDSNPSHPLDKRTATPVASRGRSRALEKRGDEQAAKESNPADGEIWCLTRFPRPRPVGSLSGGASPPTERGWRDTRGAGARRGRPGNLFDCQRATRTERGRFRDRDSNPDCLVQSQASCRWTIPKRWRETRRASAARGGRTLANPGKSRVLFLLSYRDVCA